MFVFSCGNAAKEKEEAIQENQLVEDQKAQYEIPDTAATRETAEEGSTGTISCEYKNEVAELGIGLLLAPERCAIYNNKALTDPYMVWKLSETYEPAKPACALYYKPDYGIMHYVCLDSTENYYRILVNGDQEKYVPRVYGKVFKSWQAYIHASIGGISLPADDVNGYFIRADPFESAEKMVVENNSFCPLEVKGDWVKVKPDCYTFDEKTGEDCTLYIDECKSAPTGWIRWRKGNKILIEIHQLV